MTELPDAGSHPLAFFFADQGLTPEARAARHGDAFLVLLPGILSRPVAQKVTAHVTDDGPADIAPAGFRVCLVRARDPQAAGSISAGRLADNDIFIPHDSVSKVHARFGRDRDEYVLEDAGSRNGTFVDDVAVPAGGKPRLLSSGTRVRFGSAETLFLRAEQFWRFVARISERASARR